jgi:hypothetical protein
MSEELKKDENRCCENGFFGDKHTCMKEELKKEWEQKIDDWFANPADRMFVKTGIKFLLAKQQEMTNSEWVAYGKKMGYHDYWKDMTRIALQEDFVKMIEDKQKNVQDQFTFLALDDLLADIKKLK